ncbi:four-carbon acid sugar kinase family protein [Spongiivirga citrea]|uniref:Four-carbon acid sugar kinase family protein n=1 Tax=Spongiivirga citrea TaxID=1481457 RepID=A0A6M0CJL5_9FLAO|nr:four-carbon acid sugar kinase family protein [Spongiivirga citrea]NER17802.1 hypothetical protein [Spongiivirga citrea]
MLNKKILESIQQGAELDDHHEVVSDLLAATPRVVVIIDDDPTGTQTVYNVPIVTDWSYATLEYEVINSPVFFILTNSRSLQQSQAKELAITLGLMLAEIAKEHRKKLVVISRSDSTLRGHYPYEVDALLDGLGWKNSKQVLIPGFFEGGRYTFNDIHYLKEDNDFIPVAETPFACDTTFGYAHSNLKEYIQEKYEGSIKANEVLSISVQTLREAKPQEIQDILIQHEAKHVIVNATSYADLQVFAIACLTSEDNLLYRTAASFVNAITGITPKPLLTKQSILNENQKSGGLVIVGSYVPKTTEQLKHLKDNNSKALFIKMKVSEILSGNQNSTYIKKLVKIINNALAAKKDVVLFTSRKVHVGDTKEESLAILNKVSLGLISLVRLLSLRPKYILSKGGITSSDICVKALGVRKALVLGQILKGVPVWQLDKDSKYPEMPFIVFPGNVGDKSDLYKLIKQLE